MFSVSLMGVDFGSVLLNVLAIIGIIIAGGFVVFFLGDLLISIYDPQNSALKFNKNKDNQIKQIQEPEKPQELTYAQTMKYDTVDYDKALEEEKNLKAQENQPIFYSEPVKPAEEEKKEASQSPEDIFAQLRAEEEQFKQEKLKAATEHKNVFADVESKKQEETDDDDFDFDDIFFSDEDLKDLENEEEDEDKEFKEDTEDAEEKEEQQVVVEDEKLVEDEPIEDENVDDSEELRKNEQELDELKNQNEQLKQQIEKLMQEKNETVPTAPAEILSEEELQNRLVELNERLKLNEKELRSIKKEYIPLSRVRKTLDSDKKKLRRKEALVAKQKVMLYGVNNIADIDQDKAKKLQEDLDLLDGLRLSVQHCEEVIRNSEERYPVLETSYNILTRTISEIKEDIDEVNRHLETNKK